MATTTQAPPLDARIRQAIRQNRAELPFIRKNPLTDFLSFRERARIERTEVRKAMESLVDMVPATLEFSYRLRDICSHRAAEQVIEEQLLTNDRWTSEPVRAHRLLDMIEALVDPSNAMALAIAASNRLSHPNLKVRALMIAKEKAVLNDDAESADAARNALSNLTR